MKFVKDRQPLKQTQNATMTDSTEWKLGRVNWELFWGDPRGLSLLVNLCTFRIVLVFPIVFLHFADIYQNSHFLFSCK